MDRTKPSLSIIPFFQGLPEADLQELDSVTQVKLLKLGQPLLKQGDVPAFLMFVVEGRLQALELGPDGRVVGLQLCKPGDTVGLLPLIDGQPVTCDIEALEATKLLLIPMNVARRLALTRPLIVERLLKQLALSLRSMITEKSMLSLPNAFHRVFVQIDQISGTAASGQPLTHLPKQQDLATIVNTSRETVSRALQLLVKCGILSKVGHQIVIKNTDALKRLASDGPDALRLYEK